MTSQEFVFSSQSQVWTSNKTIRIRLHFFHANNWYKIGVFKAKKHLTVFEIPPLSHNVIEQYASIAKSMELSRLII